ncbi:MAG: hypothetical protein KDB01_27220 [Planctomycetaceae bacterium]|nr:hypothetical protein [Planctomycetaceae bacterium]
MNNEQAIDIQELHQLEEIALRQVRAAMRLVCAELPYLSGLAAVVKLSCRKTVSVAAVDACGNVYVNPDVFSELPLTDAAYILAHELMHLALDTFSRKVPWINPHLINVAHDYIINDLLTQELGRKPPLGGLYQFGASQKSLEQMVTSLRRQFGDQADNLDTWNAEAGENPGRATGRSGGRGKTVSGRSQTSGPPRSNLSLALESAGIRGEETADETNSPDSAEPSAGIRSHGDLIWDEDESGVSEAERKTRQAEVRLHVERSLSMKAVRDLNLGQSGSGGGSGNCQWTIQALRSHFSPPWEAALQRWIEGNVPGDRTYSRPSRRSGDRTDVVLPGRSRIGWTLHIILDTSGSMLDALPLILGTIGTFCESAGVEQVRIVQCGDTLTADSWVETARLDQLELFGGGGGGLSPGFERLTEDPDVEAAIVITDTYEEYPADPPPYSVLWAVIANRDFIPPFGTFVFLDL